MIRVALVDDHALVRRAFSLMLSIEDDIELVGEAGDGDEAVRLAARTAPDLMLMDIEMPRRNGLEATRAIRAGQTPRPDIPIIALTAYAMPADRERFLAAGIDDAVTKPVETATLAEAIERTLARRGTVPA